MVRHRRMCRSGFVRKEFDTSKTFSAIKEKISKEMAEMNFEQPQAYLKAKKVHLEE